MAKTRKSRSIRQNIILSFSIFSLVSLIIVGGISIVFIGVIGQTTTQESTTALKDQISRNIVSSAEHNAQIINRKLSNAEQMVLAMAEECERIFSSENTYENRIAYYDYFFQHDRSAGNVPEDTIPSADYSYIAGGSPTPLYLSWSRSSYYIPGSTVDNYDTNYAALNDTIGRVMNMDYTFSYIHENAPDFRWLYIAFIDSGLFINYPGSTLAGDAAQRASSPYDPRTKDWYAEVLAGNGDIVFTAPYFDEIDGKLLITIGKAVKDTGGNFAVVCGDLLIESVKEKILDIEILESGYASLILSDGTIVAHKEWTPPPPPYTDLTYPEVPGLQDVEENSDESKTLSDSNIQTITSANTGVIEYTRDGKQRYLAYTPVGKGDYICIVIVPVSEATAAVEPLRDRINITTMATILQVVIIVVITAAISLITGIFTSDRIIKPITRLTSIASKMATSEKLREDILGEIDMDIDKKLENQQDEVGELTRAFKGMLSALKKDAARKPDKSIWD
ncbi:MAG: HAMP domain-containing protein [Candidatus Hodarchaeales archaeon]